MSETVNTRKESGVAGYVLMADVMKYRMIDAYEHPSADPGKQLDIAEKTGKVWLQISNPTIIVRESGGKFFKIKYICRWYHIALYDKEF